MKKVISVCLAVLCAFSVLTLAVSAADTQTIHVYDLLKHDVNSTTNVCRTIEIYFENQYNNFDDTKTVTFQKKDGTLVANCIPRSDNNRKFDLYAPNGDFGIVLNPTVLYYLVIPEGTYYTDTGILNAAYRGEYNGIYLSNADNIFSTMDLGISNFLAGQVAENRLYNGKLLVGAAYDTLVNAKDSVLLYKVDGKNETLIGVCSVTAYKSGRADIDFGGAEIDRWAQYKIHVQYGTFLYAGKSIINAHSDYALSGKKLLGLAENYPAIDLLIGMFGADHWTLKAVTTVLKVLSFIKLVDKALYNDIDKYIGARK